jgi:4-hydroxy-tetrahydrodipicolinate reductase
MKIALIGYGKMGKEIEAIALERGHSIILKVDIDNKDFPASQLQDCDVAIEFTNPHSVVKNIEKCFLGNVPVVIGTTGWYHHFSEVKSLCEKGNHSMLYATNFSIGVNIFFEINRRLAALMDLQHSYEIAVEEIHHTQKLDAPSGTGITIAEDIVKNISRKEKWVGGISEEKNDLNIISQRIDNIPGTHIVKYSSSIDDIEIKHVAHNRKGFALGAVLAAEWLKDKKGIFTMNDVLQLKAD